MYTGGYMVKELGFSLIELMIAVVVFAILVTIAYPNYQNYVRKTKRVEAQTELMAMGARLQQYLVMARHLKKDDTQFIGLSDLNLPTQLPQTGPVLYDVTLNVTAHTWSLIARPKSQTILAQNGILVLNHLGYRCWIPKSTVPCEPSSNTNWDNK